MTRHFIVSLLATACSMAQLTDQALADPQSIPAVVGGITVSGECLTKVVQDRGRVSLGSTSLSPTPKEASEQAIKAHEAIKAGVKALGLKDFLSETTDYSVSQECSYSNSKRICQGYRARITTQFETSEISRLGDIVAVASKMGSEEVSSLQTFASPELLKRSRETCLEAAARDAAAKAQRLASGAGVKVGRVLAIDESDGGQRPMPYRSRAFAPEMAAMSDNASTGPSIDSRPIDLQVQISVTYGIE